MRMWKRFMLLFAAVLFVGIYAESGIPADAASAERVQTVTLRADNRNVTEKSFTMAKGSRVKLTVNVLPADSAENVKYESWNKSVASVNQNGIIKAKKSGSAKIVVTVRGKRGSRKTTWVKVKVRDNIMKLKIGNQVFTATLAENSSAEALKELLKNGPLTIKMNDYANMEKVGPLGTDLPRNDQQTNTKAGDLILYEGNQFVIYYGTNSWNFTRLGRMNDITEKELKKALGEGSVDVTLSMD